MPEGIADAIAETELRLGIRAADPGADALSRLIADRDHESRMRMQQEQIQADRDAERQAAVREVEERIAPLRAAAPRCTSRPCGRRTRRFYGDGRTAEETEAVASIERTFGRRKGFTAETERQAAEVADFLLPVAGRRTPSAGPWREEADRTKDELFGPEQQRPPRRSRAPTRACVR